MKKKLMTISVAVLALAVLLMLPACAAPEPEVATLKVGCIMPFSGPASPWGDAIKPQMEVYAELINEDGGIEIGGETYQVEMFFADGEYSPEGGSRAAKELVYDKKVSFIVGYYGDGFPATAAVTNPEKVIFISKEHPDFDPIEKHPYTVIGTPVIEFVDTQILAFVEAHPGTTMVGDLESTLVEPMLAEEIAQAKSELEGRGIGLISQTHPVGITDFTTYLVKFDEEGVDLIYTWAATGYVAMMAKQSAEQGYDWYLCQAGTMLDPYEFAEMAGYEAAQGTMSDWPCPWALKKVEVSPELLEMAGRIADRYEEKYGEPMRYMGGFGYGLQHMSQLFAGLEKAGTLDPDQIMDTFKGGTFDTFLGEYTLSGEKTYGSPLVFGYPNCLSKLEGYEEVYASEHPILEIL